MDNCPDCGRDRDVWGKLHICRPLVVTELKPPKLRKSVADYAAKFIDGIEQPGGDEKLVSATYKYRDKTKRQDQVRAAMKRYRAKKKLAET